MTKKTGNIILFADDDSVLVRALSEDLESFAAKAELSLRIVGSVDEVDKMRQSGELHKTRVAIVDLWMIGKQGEGSDRGAGEKIIRFIRAAQDGCPIVVYSAHLSADTEKELRGMGNIELLAKPVTVDRLLSAVERVLGA